MRGLRILLFIVLPLSFTFGLAWGWKIRRDRALREGARLESHTTVRLLSLASIVSPESLREFETLEPIKVQIETARGPTELLAKWRELKAKNLEPDLVTLFYSQMPGPPRALRAIETTRLANAKWIAPDFVDWPGSDEWPKSVPLVWGFDGWGRPAPPEGRGRLWVIALAMTAGASDVEATHKVIDYLLSKPAALKRVKLSRFGSTSLETDSAPQVPVEQKPSFLRRLPLTDYVLDLPSKSSVRATEITSPERE